MIYLDCAATSLQKPAPVYDACENAMRTMASPGRGGHAPAMRAADEAYRCRALLAELFNVPSPERVVFTQNATHGLNIAIKSLVSPGDRVVTSCWEHNSVTRPLRMLGAEVDSAEAPIFDRHATLEAFRKKLPGASAAVCTHVSNAFGFILPIYEIAGLCRELGVPLIVDASQSAGALPVDAARLGAEFIAMPGHKGLLGPQGTGVLLCLGDDCLPLIAGGTGSESRLQSMPELLPDRLEAGTQNITGISGLAEGVSYVLSKTPEKLGGHERRLCRLMIEGLSGTPGIEMFVSGDPEAQAGVLSIRHSTVGCEELGEELGNRGVAARAGLHCAPMAHGSAGTLETGTVRFSFSPFNTSTQVWLAAGETRSAIKKLSRNAK